MKTKYAPTKWVLNKWETKTYIGIEIKDQKDNLVCTMAQYNAESNAKIIAVAPELLEALIELAFLCDLTDEKQKEINKLIKKATE
jgi:hypothetical protein